MSKSIESQTITFTPEGSKNKVNIFITKYENEKNARLRGFANISVLSADNKMLKQFNSLSIIEGKNTHLFVVEPKQKAYKDKDGEWASNPYFLMDKAMKEDIAKRIEDKAFN